MHWLESLLSVCGWLMVQNHQDPFTTVLFIATLLIQTLLFTEHSRAVLDLKEGLPFLVLSANFLLGRFILDHWLCMASGS